MATTSEPTDQHDAGPELAAPETPEAPGMSDDAPLAEDEVLLEEISIDGMCGVY